MITLFPLLNAASDKSIYYLGKLYGNIGGVIPGTATVTDGPGNLIAFMFQQLSTVALTIGSLIVTYVIIVGLLRTATEGEFLGRQWSSLWVPVRTVAGIVLLFPTKSGYCAIQVIMMWVIIQGIGAANQLWDKAITYIGIMGSPYASVSVPKSQLRANMTALFQGLTCQASALNISNEHIGENCNQSVGSSKCKPFYFCYDKLKNDHTVYHIGCTMARGKYSSIGLKEDFLNLADDKTNLQQSLSIGTSGGYVQPVASTIWPICSSPAGMILPSYYMANPQFSYFNMSYAGLLFPMALMYDGGGASLATSCTAQTVGNTQFDIYAPLSLVLKQTMVRPSTQVNQAQTLSNGTILYQMGPGGMCGAMTYPDPNARGGICQSTDTYNIKQCLADTLNAEKQCVNSSAIGGFGDSMKSDESRLCSDAFRTCQAWTNSSKARAKDSQPPDACVQAIKRCSPASWQTYSDSSNQAASSGLFRYTYSGSYQSQICRAALIQLVKDNMSACWYDASYGKGLDGRPNNLVSPISRQGSGDPDFGDSTVHLVCQSMLWQPAVLQTITNMLGSIASQLAEYDRQYVQFYEAQPAYVNFILQQPLNMHSAIMRQLFAFDPGTQYFAADQPLFLLSSHYPMMENYCKSRGINGNSPGPGSGRPYVGFIPDNLGYTSSYDIGNKDNNCCIAPDNIAKGSLNPNYPTCSAGQTTYCNPPDNGTSYNLQCYKKSANVFPSATDNYGGKDYTNASIQAVSEIYWPFGIKPVLDNSLSKVLASINQSQLSEEEKAKQTKLVKAFGYDFIGLATEKYADTVSTAINGALQQMNQQIQNCRGGLTQQGNSAKACQPLPPGLASAPARGWLVAGGYYYSIASMNRDNGKAALPMMTVTGQLPDNEMKNYRNNYKTAAYLVQAIQMSQDSDGSASPQVTPVMNTFSGGWGDMLQGLQNRMTGNRDLNTNPLVNVVAFGQDLLQMGFDFAIAWFTLGAVLIGVGSINPMALGTGLTTNPIGEVLKYIFNSLNALIIFFIGICFIYGGLLGIYVPLIPYILFTMGGISWFIATIEAMVAAPFVALGIMMPGGHEVMGHGERATMFIFNTFLRPSLMIFGMMASMVLSPIAVDLLNETFNQAAGSVNGSPGPVEGALFLTLYVALVVAILQKCFNLIYIIPNRILMWIGGPEVSHGEESALHGMEEKTRSSAQTMGGGAGQAIQGGTQAAGGALEKKIRKQENEDKSKAGNVGSGDSKAGGGSGANINPTTGGTSSDSSRNDDNNNDEQPGAR